MKYQRLISIIGKAQHTLQNSDAEEVNSRFTLRNWLIECHIAEFERKGENRTKYGEKLLNELATALKIKGLGETNLKQC